MPGSQSSGVLDTLTGLLKREVFSRQLAEYAATCARDSRIFSMAVIDIDHFKSINDGFGHSRGDEILTEFGRRAQSITREGDLLFRYGGDEFTAILPDEDIHEAERFAARMLKACSDQLFAGDPPLSVTLSIGVAQFPEDGNTARELFNSADKRLYSAKRDGRNRVVSSDDAVPGDDPGVHDGRLLGREKELAVFVSFAQEAAEKGRGFFMVLGPDGAGKGCFLDAAASYLSLSDYRLLSVIGSGESHTNHCDLADALDCKADRSSMVDALRVYADNSMSLGIFLEDVHMMDRTTLEILVDFYMEYPGWLIVAASTERSSVPETAGFTGVSSSIRLGPVSLEDCRAWFRASLMWNPPNEFLEWFHGETGGLPGLFNQGITHLERRGYVSRKNGGFLLEEDYREFALGSRMEFSTAAEINNLPVDLTPFLGREKELDKIRDLIDQGARLITLRGMSGMGCRRLAIRASGQNEFLFPSGICMVDCSENDLPVEVKLASELSLPSGRSAAETVISFIEDSRILLLFVNVSTDDRTISFISSLLGSCSGLSIIVTSRTSLDLPGETVVPVEGVSTQPSEGEDFSPAAKIFLQTAERLAGLKSTDEFNHNLVEEICSLLGGAPLAIELAASWTRVMSLPAICRRIRANPSFLGGTDSDKSSQGLSELFQQSWDQLSGVERNALSRLTVFAGHFTVEEAEDISDVSPEMVLSLVDRSFLLRDDMGIHIPAMTRDFIIQENSPFPRGFEVAREMHCRYFAARAAALGEMARTGREAGRGLDGIKSSFEDISLAWKLAVNKHRFRFLRQMLNPLYIYCQDRGRFRTGYNMMEDALKSSGAVMPDGLAAVIMACQSNLAFKTGRMTSSVKLISNAMTRSAELQDSDRAQVLLIKGTIMIEKGVLAGALEYLQQAAELFSVGGDSVGALETELQMVKYHLQCGDYGRVRRLLPDLADRCRRASYRIGEWRTRLYMGNLASSEGDYRRARESLMAYLSAVRTAGYTGRCATALNQVAGIEASQGNYAEAEQHYSTAADYFRRIGSIRGHAGIKMNLAVMNQMRGNSELVRKYYSEALTLGEKAHDENIISGSLNGLAFFYIHEGSTEKAESFLLRAADISRRAGNNPVLLRVLYGFALLDHQKGNPERSASTAIALLHDRASDAEIHGFCMELLQKIRKSSGAELVERQQKKALKLSLDDLLKAYTEGLSVLKDTAYRKG